MASPAFTKIGDYTINRAEILEKSLKGGNVVGGKDQNGDSIAARIIPLKDFKSKELLTSFQDLIDIPRHASLLHALDVVQMEDEMILICKRAKGQPLRSYLATGDDEGANFEIIFQLAEAVNHLHKHGYACGNLSLLDVFVSVHDGLVEVEVADCGLVSALTAALMTQTTATPFMGMDTMKYLAPEIFKTSINFGGNQIPGRRWRKPEVDVFSLGRIIQDILKKTEPNIQGVHQRLQDIALSMVKQTSARRHTMIQVMEELNAVRQMIAGSIESEVPAHCNKTTSESDDGNKDAGSITSEIDENKADAGPPKDRAKETADMVKASTQSGTTHPDCPMQNVSNAQSGSSENIGYSAEDRKGRVENQECYEKGGAKKDPHVDQDVRKDQHKKDATQEQDLKKDTTLDRDTKKDQPQKDITLQQDLKKDKKDTTLERDVKKDTTQNREIRKDQQQKDTTLEHASKTDTTKKQGIKKHQPARDTNLKREVKKDPKVTKDDSQIGEARSGKETPKQGAQKKSPAKEQIKIDGVVPDMKQKDVIKQKPSENKSKDKKEAKESATQKAANLETIQPRESSKVTSELKRSPKKTCCPNLCIHVGWLMVVVAASCATFYVSHSCEVDLCLGTSDCQEQYIKIHCVPSHLSWTKCERVPDNDIMNDKQDEKKNQNKESQSEFTGGKNEKQDPEINMDAKDENKENVQDDPKVEDGPEPSGSGLAIKLVIGIIILILFVVVIYILQGSTGSKERKAPSAEKPKTRVMMSKGK